MGFISVDLGTTNVKAAAFDDALNILSEKSVKIDYIRQDDRVEFDAEEYYQIVAKTINACCNDCHIKSEVHQVVLTGQAESLVLIGKNGMPVRNAISWLDERSKEECRELEQIFSNETCFSVTGQISVIPTWPITKILWIKKNEPEIFAAADKFLLLKDYIQYRLTGEIVGEFSIYNFSFYFDIRNKCYWKDMLDYCCIGLERFPKLVEPCTNIGAICEQAAQETGLSRKTTVNVGTLDHFASMIGTGNIKEGIVSESTGTVLTLATLIDKRKAAVSHGIPCHYGPFKDSYVLLSVCESGGVSLEWYKNSFMQDVTFIELNRQVEKLKRPGDVLFLPYLTGVNAPDYDKNAKGVFYGLRIRHDKYDLALAVMEGVAYMLCSNINKLVDMGINVDKIIATGGGARSRIWSQIKADVTGCDVIIPKNREGACLGAAIIGSVDAGVFKTYQQAVEESVKIDLRIKSCLHEEYRKKYEQYNSLLYSLRPVFDIV